MWRVSMYVCVRVYACVCVKDGIRVSVYVRQRYMEGVEQSYKINSQTYTHTQTHTSTSTYTCIYICIPSHIYTYPYAYKYYTHRHMHIYTRTTETVPNIHTPIWMDINIGDTRTHTHRCTLENRKQKPNIHQPCAQP